MSKKLRIASVSLCLWFAVTSALEYNEYLNENYTIFELVNASISDYVNITEAKDYCWNNFGTYLASYHSDSDTDSYISLASIYGIENETAWIGAYDTTNGNSDLYTGWIWFDGTDWNYTLWADGQPSLGDQQCAFWRYDAPGTWGDYRCSGGVVSGVGHCAMFVCNTALNRDYQISVTVPNTPEAATTKGRIWFRIQGSIAMVSNESDTWTDWFTYYDNSTNSTSFETSGKVYTWNVNVENVGPPKKIIVLSQQSDSFRFNKIEVDSMSYTDTSGMKIVYNDGPSNTGCGYIVIDFETQNSTNVDYTTECPFDNMLPTTEPSLRPSSIPSVVPTLVPSNVPNAMSTNMPSHVPSDWPSNLPSDLPTIGDEMEITTSETENGSDELGSGNDNIFGDNVVIFIIGAISGVVLCALALLMLYCWNLKRLDRKKEEKQNNKQNKEHVALSIMNPGDTNTTDVTTTNTTNITTAGGNSSEALAIGLAQSQSETQTAGKLAGPGDVGVTRQISGEGVSKPGTMLKNDQWTESTRKVLGNVDDDDEHDDLYDEAPSVPYANQNYHATPMGTTKGKGEASHGDLFQYQS